MTSMRGRPQNERDLRNLVCSASLNIPFYMGLTTIPNVFDVRQKNSRVIQLQQNALGPFSSGIARSFYLKEE